jgi:DNA-binding response OmpR family regulator
MTQHVLVVDDEISMQRLLRAQLHEFDFTVMCVGTTSAAEAALRQEAYCGMLLDYQLPGEDGLAFLQRVDGGLRLPPTLIVTGHDLLPLQARSLPACVKGLLAKPFEFQTLGQVTMNAFGQAAVCAGATPQWSMRAHGMLGA